MKKIILFIPVMLLLVIENVDAMHRRSMKRIHKQRSGSIRKFHNPKKHKMAVTSGKKKMRKSRKATQDNRCSLKSKIPVSCSSSASQFHLPKSLIPAILVCVFFSQQASCYCTGPQDNSLDCRRTRAGVNGLKFKK